jgi:hypothetical protein
MEAVHGHVPCGYCGAVNAPPVNPYAAVPSGAQPLVCPVCRLDNAPNNTVCRACGNVLRHAAVHAPPAGQAVAQAWGCPACRHENQAHYKFCLGCGEARREGGGEPVERRYGCDGNPASSRQRSPVLLVVLIVTIIIVVGAIAGVAAMSLAR